MPLEFCSLLTQSRCFYHALIAPQLSVALRSSPQGSHGLLILLGHWFARVMNIQLLQLRAMTTTHDRPCAKLLVRTLSKGCTAPLGAERDLCKPESSLGKAFAHASGVL